MSNSSDIHDKHVYTVSEITQDIKVILENTFHEVWVEGEVSNFRPSAAGHNYFSLKDQQSLLSAVLFNRAAREIKFKIEDGLKVVCFGTIEVYGPRGQYQLIVEKIEPKGLGGLQLALEQLKQKLEKEGLFSPAHKKQIPALPARIGVVTSLQGAAIKDILKVLDRRFKETHIIINPVRVQGEGSKEDIAQAVIDFNSFNQQAALSEQIDVLIVGRGGGSIEDLWAFNEEVVARAIYNSKIPIISAVGHERDTTIADLVADVRAATPSVAAEIVIPKKEDLQEQIDSLTQDVKRALLEAASGFEDTMSDLLHRISLGIDHILELKTSGSIAVYKKLLLLNPLVSIQRSQEEILDLAKQINVRIAHFIKLQDAEFTRVLEKLSSLSPLSILARGYSITFQLPEGKAIKEAQTVRVGDTIRTKLHKGELICNIKEVHNNG